MRSIKLKKLGMNLQKMRRRAGLAQTEVTEVLGFNSAQYLSNVERGLCYMSAGNIPILALLYGVSSRSIAGPIANYLAGEFKEEAGC